MKKKYITFILLYLFFMSFCESQNETSKWYFGTQAGLDFISGAPVNITGSIMSSDEAFSSIADAAGNLLFYTNGIWVANKNNQVMTNSTGLNGDPSTTQTLIVKRPGSNTIYYIFTADVTGGPKGYCYTTVDMSLSGGLGAVTTKNTLLNVNNSEKMVGVRHCNGVDVWVITHDHSNNTFRSYLVTAAGVSSVPVISNAGAPFVQSQFYDDAVGQMKASPDGSRLATSFGGDSNTFEIYDFNKSTGVVSNAINLGPNYVFAYGVEFSPDNTKLYTSHRGGTSPALLQWNLCAGNTASIIASKTLIANPFGGFFGFFSLQLASDGKIYASPGQGATTCSVINNPNVLGLACNFTNAGPSIAPNTHYFGLPNFVSSYFEKITPLATVTVVNTSACLSNGSATATIAGGCGNNQYTYTWSNGTIVGPTSNLSNTISNLSGGNYHVIINDMVCRKDTIYFSVAGGSGSVSSNQNVAICPGNNFVLPDGSIANTAGTYLDTVLSVNGCDSIVTTILTISNFVTGAQSPVICSGNSFTLPDGSIVNTSGTYVDTVNVSGGCDSIVTTTLLVNPPSTNAQAITRCSGTNYTLPGGIVVNTSGVYTDTLVTSNGCDSIVITTLSMTAAVTSAQNPIICSGNNYTLPGGTIVTTSGTYTDTLIASGGCDSVITTVLVVNPNSSSNSNPIVCSGNSYQLPDGTQVIVGGVYVDTILSFNGCDSIITTSLTVNPSPMASVSADVTIQVGQSTTLSATGGTIYNWTPSVGLNNTTGSSVIANPATTTIYCAEVSNTNGCKDTACVTVTVTEVPCSSFENLNIPNAFSPNMDGVNDDFCLQGWDICLENFSIFIFNRFGEKVFESKDPNFCWDGKFRNTLMDAQVFVFYMKASFTNFDKPITKNGNISLIR